MRILEAAVSTARYCRDFGRVEARVTLVVKERQGMAIHSSSVLVSVPARSPDMAMGLRERIVQEAKEAFKMRPKRRSAPQSMAMAA